MQQIINQNRTYEGIIVGYDTSKVKTDKFGKPFTSNPLAFIWPKDTSLQIMMAEYRDLAGKTCKNPENIVAVIPLPGQGERRWTKGNATITQFDCGKHVRFNVTEPDKQGLPQAINVTIINPEETLDEDLRQEAAEEVRLELAELAQTAPVTVAPVAVAKDVAVQNGVAALAIDEIEEDPLDYDDAEEDDYAYENCEKPSRQKKSKRLDKKSHRREWDE